MSPADVLIIGGGPAGRSAALTLVRQRHPVVLFDSGKSRALPSLKLHGVPGSDGKPPAEVMNGARAELSKYNDYTEVSAEIVGIKKVDDAFEATTSTGQRYQGRKVILANGLSDHFPDIPGYAENWGKRIFHNPFAQGYEQEPWQSHCGVLAVDWIAMPQYALHLTHLLSQLTPHVTIYTHGNIELGSILERTLACSAPAQSVVTVDTRFIARLSSDENFIKVHFSDGHSNEEIFLGHAAITKLNGRFAEQLGLEVSQSGAEYVVSGPTNSTNVNGVYAAGDAMNMLKVWPSAIASGAVTAAGVAIALQEERWKLDPIFG